MLRRNRDDVEERPRLQSLAQAARSNKLKQVRGTLLAIGFFMVACNFIGLVSLPAQMRQAVVRPGGAPNAPGDLTVAHVAAMVVNSSAVFIGVLFFVFGFLVNRYPLPITVASLVVYGLQSLAWLLLLVLSARIDAAVTGRGLGMSIIFRIAFFVALAKAVMTAYAYQHEQRADLAVAEGAFDDNSGDEQDRATPQRPPAPAPAASAEQGIQADGPRPLRVKQSADVVDRDEVGIQAESPHPLPHPLPRHAPEDPLEPILSSAAHDSRRQPPRARSTALDGRVFALDRGRPYLGFAFAIIVLVTLAFVSVQMARAYWWQLSLGYMALIGMCCVVFLARYNPRRLHLSADGIEMTRPDVQLAYHEILEIHAPEQRRADRSSPIHLLHASGYCTIPPSAHELLDYLEAQPLGVREIPKVAPILRDFLKQQLALHGPDRVYVYRSRVEPLPPRYFGFGFWPGASMLLAALGMSVLAMVLRQPALFGVGPGLIAVAMLFFLVGAALRTNRSPRTPIKDWQQAMLIIGPDGLALVQGDLTGEVRWHELKGVRLGRGTAGASTGANSRAIVWGIQLQVAGADITIADIYHWPLSHALEQIERHWRER
jgi:hypothetical protein